MEIKKLELSEYSECIEESVKYAITPLYWPIYCFYKTHSQQNCYQILFDSSESLSSVVSSNEIPMFSDYGINFTKSLSVVPRQRVFIAIHTFDQIISDERFNAEVRDKFTDVDKDYVGLVFIECPGDDDGNVYESLSQSEKVAIVERLKEVYPRATIATAALNIYIPAIESEKPKIKATVKLDDVLTLQDLLGDAQTYNGLEMSIKLILRFIKKIASVKADMIDASESNISNRFSNGDRRCITYICLMKYNKLVYFDQLSYRALIGFQRDLMSRDAMYAEDFLYIISHLPDIAVYYKTEPIIVLPNKKFDYFSDIVLRVIECKIDLDTMTLDTGQEVVQYYYPNIELLSTANLFNLNSEDFDTAKAGADRLQKLYKSFSYHCAEEIDISEITFNISNVIFYKQGDETFMAYLSSIKADTKFMAYPVREKCRPFEMTLDMAKETLCDIRLFEDWKEVVYPFLVNGYVKKNHICFPVQRYIMGVCLYSQGLGNQILSKDIGLTFEEAGIYNDMSWSLRKFNTILHYVKRDCIVDNMSTPFGGLHPMVQNTVTIKREDWRSDHDRLHQFNTY